MMNLPSVTYGEQILCPCNPCDLLARKSRLMFPKGDNSLGEELSGYAIHEAYHAGELAMIRNWLQRSKID